MMNIEHILVPTDFSDPSDRALEMAIEVARAFDAQLTLLHVWTVPSTGYADALAWPVQAMEREARRALDDELSRTLKLYAKTDSLLQDGTEWRQIIAAVRERSCDLVVMGTHGRRGLSRLVLGSVAEKVMRLSPVPVITVGEARGSKGHESEAAR